MSEGQRLKAWLAILYDHLTADSLIPVKNTYRVFYSSVGDERLSEIFGAIHGQLNFLFDFMNKKNTLGRGGHYNAAQSRQLLTITRYLDSLQEGLLKGPFCFELNEYYKSLLDRCRRFLVESDGSLIPEDFPIIKIIMHQPIFVVRDTLEILHLDLGKIPLTMVGEGSYAFVYKYKDPTYDRFIALKRAKDDLTPKELERFNREFLLAPHIVENIDRRRMGTYPPYYGRHFGCEAFGGRVLWTSERQLS